MQRGGINRCLLCRMWTRIESLLHRLWDGIFFFLSTRLVFYSKLWAILQFGTHTTSYTSLLYYCFIGLHDLDKCINASGHIACNKITNHTYSNHLDLSMRMIDPTKQIYNRTTRTRKHD